jgi:hypothetical protein
MAIFPGYEKYFLENGFGKIQSINRVAAVVWILLHTISTIITIFAIKKIYDTVRTI